MEFEGYPTVATRTNSICLYFYLQVTSPVCSNSQFKMKFALLPPVETGG